MWHVSAPHRPCIGHRTGYSLLENARTSGLASADFEGVFAHSYKRWRPRLFLRALRKLSPQNCSSVAASAACAPLNPAYGADELDDSVSSRGGALTIHPRKARSWRKVAVVWRELNRA